MTTDVYRKIAAEIESGAFEPVAWTRAFAEADGNQDKAKAIYIRLRHAELSGESAAPFAPSSNQATLTPAPLKSPAPTELERIRNTLTIKLAASGKNSFYNTLGLTPQATDTDIAQIITALKGREARGEMLTPEQKYAIETIAAPALREAYDRKLLSILNELERRVAEVDDLADTREESTLLRWWSSRKVSALVGVVAVVALGTTGLGFVKEKTQKDVAAQALTNQQKAIEYAGESETYRVRTERIGTEGTIENQAAAIDTSAQIAAQREETARYQAELRARNEAERIELERERIAAQSKQTELRMQQSEQARLDRLQQQKDRENQRALEEQRRQNKKELCYDARQRNNPGEIAKWCSY